jgi:predicted ester cyclase
VTTAAVALAMSSNVSTQSAAQETAAPMVRFVEEVWNRGNYAVMPQIVAPNALWHYGSVAFKADEAVVRRWRAGFPDFHFTIEDTIVQGERVAMRLSFTGTQLGPFWNQAPSGKTINVTQQTFCRVRDGRLQECWEDWDELGMRRQLGLIAP